LPKRSGLFWKLVFSFVALSVATVAVLAWVFANAYETLLERDLESRLSSVAAPTAELLATDWPAAPGEQSQSMVHRLATLAGVRVTVLAIDGRVLADSYYGSPEEVAAAEGHANRPEFMAAVRTGAGTARRVSPTAGVRFRYHAVRIEVGGRPVGVVRIAAPTAPLAAEMEGLRRWLWSIGLAVALASSSIAYWAATRLTAPLRTLALMAERLTAGDYALRAAGAAGGTDEFQELASALDAVARQLDERERQLHRSSETQATVLEGMSESVIAVDRNEKILFANASAGRALGFDAQKAGGGTLLEAVRSHELRSAMKNALHTRQLCNIELTWRGKSVRTFDVLATPLPGNPPPGVVLVLRDVSEIKRLEQSRQQFFANVSHELKTPLSSIRAYTETLLEGAHNDPVHREKFLQRIDEQAARLNELILDMLSLARIETSQVPLETGAIAVQRAAARCLADYEPQAAARKVVLAALEGEADLEVRADEDALRQILNNLVDNAIKSTPPGGRVTLAWRRADAMVAIEVADTGIGIAGGHHERLFERFYRVDKARSRELGGTGLGLSIVKHLCQAMGGRIAVKSEVGRGSTFTVLLPLASARAAAREES
jgi:two-component system phosphate regulon sensor histidine kinase PhoR